MDKNLLSKIEELQNNFYEVNKRYNLIIERFFAENWQSLDKSTEIFLIEEINKNYENIIEKLEIIKNGSLTNPLQSSTTNKL